MPFFVYIVQCSDGTYYCGYTKNLKRRIKEHNNSKKGAKSLRGKKPVELKYFEKYETLSDALKRECRLKKYSRQEKMILIEKNKKH